MLDLFIPIALSCLFLISIIKKKNAYTLFCEGAKSGISLVMSILPYIVCIMLMISFLEISGVSAFFIKIFSPILQCFGISEELTKLVCLRPLTGSGSLAILMDIVTTYGAQSEISKCACVIFSCTETVFFTTAIYYGSIDKKCPTSLLIICLAVSFVAMILGCNLCKLFCLT